MKQSELKALISLLDDKDPFIYNAVKEKLLSLDETVIPYLKSSELYVVNDLYSRRVDEISNILRYKSLDEEFLRWLNNDGQLLYGAFLIAKYRYPEIKYEDVEDKLNKITADLRTEINFYLTGLQQIRKINHTLFNIHRFTPDFSDIISPSTSYLNKVLENKKSNDVIIAVVYIYIARKLGLPVYGVDFPGNFLLVFKDERTGKSLFYVNPANKGAIVSKTDIKTYLKNHNIGIKERYFEACSNKIIIKRLLKVLMSSYIQKNNKTKTEEIKRILNLF